MPISTENILTKTIRLTDQSVKKYRAAPIADALLQAIYNSIDADATTVKLFVYDNQGSLFDKNNQDSDCKKIVIEDNGTGIDFDQIDNIFLPLEDSWKKNKETTPIYHRPYHGHLGSGRFKYLAIGDNILWDIVYEKHGKYYKYQMSFDTKNPQKLNVVNEIEVSPQPTGTKLTITSLTNKFNAFFSKSNLQNELISGLLLDLTLCKDNLQIFIQNNEIILDNLIETRKVFHYQIDDINKVEVPVDCEIVIWKKKILFVDHKHTFYYNNKKQYMDQRASGIPAGAKLPNHTIIIISELFNNYNPLDKAFSLIFYRIEKAYENDALKLLTQVKNAHLSESLNAIIENPLYPLKKQPQNAIEDAQRTAFNACLYNLLLNDDGVISEKKTSVLKVIFPLLQRSFSGDYILTDNLDKIIELSSDDAEKYNRMVNRIKLSKIIEKYSVLIHRKEFLRTLEKLVYDETVAQYLEERTQLHKIVAEEAWIFGDKFENEDLVSSDRSLITMIRTLNLREDLYFEDNISDKKLQEIEGFIKQNRQNTENCLNKIPDLVLCKKEDNGRVFNHLLIELKKPKVAINNLCREQALKVYKGILNASHNNGGLKISETHKWQYCLVSSRISDTIKSEFTKDGHLEEKSNGNYIIDCKTWREIIDDADRRINQKLEKIETDICDEDCQNLLNQYKEKFNLKINE